MRKKKTHDKLRKLISERNSIEVTRVFDRWLSPELVPEIADLIATISDEEKVFTFTALPSVMATRTFKVLDSTVQKYIIKNSSYEQAAEILNRLQPDDRTEFLSELSSQTVKELLKLLSEEERILTLKQLGYPEHSTGRLMTPEYITIKQNWTVKQVLDHIRKNGKDKETINVIYVVDDEGVLVDDIRIREFLLVDVDKVVADIMDHKFISLHANDPEEFAVNIFRKNNRVALPVTDDHGILLGIVTIDDVLRLSEKEGTKDIQKIGGVEVLNEPYLNISFLTLMKKRSGWLVVLFLGEMLTATAMSYFENEIAKAVVLALFIPLIISSGGNSGSQASTLIIRAMALGEVTLRDWWKIMRREICSGLFLGLVLGIIGFIRVATWTLFTNIYGPHWFLVGLVVCISLIGVVLWGTLSGSMLPLILKKLGADPAVSSAPFVATLVDVTGLVIYFTTAFIIMHGTLL